MKLYAFTPDGHGPKSYFVMAGSMDEATHAVAPLASVQRIYGGDWPDGYELAIYDPLEVAMNSND